MYWCAQGQPRAQELCAGGCALNLVIAKHPFFLRPCLPACLNQLSLPPPPRAPYRPCLQHVAARAGHVGCASLLLQADADPAALDSRGRTPLDLAQAHGRAELVQLLRQWLPPGKEVSDAASPAASPGAASTPLPAARPLLLADQQREKGDAGIVLPVPPARHSGAPAAEGTGTPSSAAAAEEQSAPLPSQKPKPPRRSLLGVFLRGAVGALGFVSTLAVVVVLLAVVVVDVECDGNSSVCAPT